MKGILVALVAALALMATGSSSAAPAIATQSMCSDLAYLNSAIVAAKLDVKALKLTIRSKWSLALYPARRALVVVKTSEQPCDSDYWLQRQYEIKYGVALQRYIEENRDGNFDLADGYWQDLRYWSRQIRDVQLSK